MRSKESKKKRKHQREEKTKEFNISRESKRCELKNLHTEREILS